MSGSHSTTAPPSRNSTVGQQNSIILLDKYNVAVRPLHLANPSVKQEVQGVMRDLRGLDGFVPVLEVVSESHQLAE